MLPSIRVTVLDVGQADTIIVHTAGPSSSEREAVVVDCADAGRVFDYLHREGIIRVHAVVITHFHSDHYKGVMPFYRAYNSHFPEQTPPRLVYRNLPNRAEIRRIFQNDERYVNSFMHFSRSLLENQRVAVETACPGTRAFVEHPWQGVLEVYHPSERHLVSLMAGDYNNVSVVLKVNGNAASALLTGDVQTEGWRAMCAELGNDSSGAEILQATFLKCPHHGAWRDRASGRNADFDEVLRAVNPAVTLVSVGARQPGAYDHPQDHVFASMHSRNVRAVCTQATAKCCRRVVENSHQTFQSGSIGSPGPCAGDIILDLDRSGLNAMLRPNADDHSQRVITHFPSHRCCLSDQGLTQETLF